MNMHEILCEKLDIFVLKGKIEGKKNKINYPYYGNSLSQISPKSS